ncbi:MAG: hypothetical protein KKH22_04070 [Proteobacteria bacterium]|nr:hypothetical protein [Pseudomonadota bacterium]
MSTFRNAISAILGKETYLLLGDKPVKATVLKISDDLAVVKISDASIGYSEIAIHIDRLILVTA